MSPRTLLLSLLGCTLAVACASPSPEGVDAAADGASLDAARDGAVVDAPALDAATSECHAPFAACAPSPGSTAFVRLRGTVVTPAGVLCDGEVLYGTTTGRIVCADADCSGHAEADGAQVVCADGVIFPGLIDPHQHADYNHMPVFRHERRYDNRNTWRNYEPLYSSFKIPHRPFGSTNRVNQRLAQRYAEMRIAMAGATSMAGTAGALLSDGDIAGWVRNVDSTSTASSGLTGAYVDPDTDSVIVVQSTGAPDEAMTATHLGTVRGRMTSDARYRAFLPHIAEGIDANARAEFDVADRDGVITAQTAIIHCAGCSTAQFARMAQAHTDLIWSPRSNIDLYGETADVTTAHALGVTIALGVDWTPSGSMNPIGELQCAAHLNERYYDRAFTDAELVAMSTVNGAIAMNLDDQLGKLAAGYHADVAVFAGDRTRPYRALLDARAEGVRLVVVAGRAIYGDTSLLAGAAVAGMSCMPVPDGLSPDGMPGVCGVAKSVCAQPADLAGLRAMLTTVLTTTRAADATCAAGTGDHCYAYELYPLFRCGGPELDRCDFGHPAIPRRAMGGGMIPAVSGAPVAGVDDDGDGVPNASDDCPRVFNPPFDLQGAQDDADGDGTGDACDGTPCLRADGSNACVAGSVSMDGGVPDGGASDVPAALTLSIPMARTGASRPAMGTRVTVANGVVTAVKAAGTSHAIFVQDPSATAFAGLYVFVGTAPVAVGVGDAVSVTGTFTTYMGLDQIDVRGGGAVTRTGAGMTPAPLEVTPADIATGGARAAELQSMLVRVTSVTAATATVGTDFTVDGGLRVTSFVANDTGASPFPAMAGDGFASITGVVYAFTDSKLAPRAATDLVRR
jgi:hypothetical protein